MKKITLNSVVFAALIALFATGAAAQADATGAMKNGAMEGHGAMSQGHDAMSNGHDAMATVDPFDRDQALAISRAALGRELSSLTFQNARGERVALADFRGKPLIISPIYTSCYHICPTTTKHLDSVVDKAQAVLGETSFNVVTVGFDTFRDTPPMMQEFARNQRIDRPNWQFLSADKPVMDTLTQELGFIYRASGGGFDHLIQTSIIDSEGRVYRQVYGMTFDSPHLIEPLKQLVFQTTEQDSFFSSLSKQVRLFCTEYDPAADKYRFDYSLFIGIAISILCLGFVSNLLFREWRKTIRAGI